VRAIEEVSGGLACMDDSGKPVSVAKEVVSGEEEAEEADAEEDDVCDSHGAIVCIRVTVGQRCSETVGDDTGSSEERETSIDSSMPSNSLGDVPDEEEEVDDSEYYRSPFVMDAKFLSVVG